MTAEALAEKLTIVSINVGVPRTFDYFGHTVTTSIYKSPVDGPVMVRKHNIDGDEQSDTRVFNGRQVHGGTRKAVYIYAAEHYDYWRQEMHRAYPYGQFGENLTATGMLEDRVRIGETFRIGEVLLRVTEPRSPCYKLDIRMEQPEFKETFRASGRIGFYAEVLAEGVIRPGDRIERVESDPSQPTVLEAFRGQQA